MSMTSHLFKFLRGKRPLIGVPVIILNSKKEILLGKRSKMMPLYPGMWGLPGGIMSYNETPEQTAKREVKEEMSIKIELIKRLDIKNNPPNKKCRAHLIDIPFTAKIIKGKPEPKDETTEVRWFKPGEIRKIELAYSHKKILMREKLI